MKSPLTFVVEVEHVDGAELSRDEFEAYLQDWLSQAEMEYRHSTGEQVTFKISPRIAD